MAITNADFVACGENCVYVEQGYSNIPNVLVISGCTLDTNPHTTGMQIELTDANSSITVTSSTFTPGSMAYLLDIQLNGDNNVRKPFWV